MNTFQQRLVIAVAAAFAFAPFGRAAVIDVPGQSNIFGAGHASAPGPAGGGGGTLPPVFDFTGPTVLTLAVTGQVTYNGANFYGADGGQFLGASTDMSSIGGISGIIQSSRVMFLIGVFVNSLEPSDPAPPRLDFSDPTFTTVSPLLNQTFFIGDGLTGTGTGSVQQFNAPTGATRLFLGFADGINFSGQPGTYGDNAGTIQATVTIVPEPSSALLLLSGSLLLLRRRTLRTNERIA